MCFIQVTGESEYQDRYQNYDNSYYENSLDKGKPGLALDLLLHNVPPVINSDSGDNEYSIIPIRAVSVTYVISFLVLVSLSHSRIFCCGNKQTVHRRRT